jgi:hypothetical protein
MTWLRRSAFVRGPTPPGTGVIAEATRAADSEIDVADELAVDDVDAHVDDDHAGPQHLAGHEAGPAGGHHHDVGAPHVPGQVAGLRVADRDGGVFADEEVRRRHADDRRSPDDDRLAAGDRDIGPLEDLDRGVRRRRQEPVVAQTEEAGV